MGLDVSVSSAKESQAPIPPPRTVAEGPWPLRHTDGVQHRRRTSYLSTTAAAFLPHRTPSQGRSLGSFEEVMQF
ncbi:hypothetical protein M8818_002335 [Zalaria obscura]|uniref:Uncharacterized protein n=1 Tax=Zalaria obscura TaxID=2024903 RepID=A0ACC3SIF0_9PEZI